MIVSLDAFVCISSEVASRIGEYNRTVATAINAYVGPAAETEVARAGDPVLDDSELA